MLTNLLVKVLLMLIQQDKVNLDQPEDLVIKFIEHMKIFILNLVDMMDYFLLMESNFKNHKR